MERDSPLGRSLGLPLRSRSHCKREPEAPAEGIVPRHQSIPVDRSRALRLILVSTRMPSVKTRLTLVSDYKCDSIGAMRYARAQHVFPHHSAEKPKPGTHWWSGIVPSDGASVSRCARDRITNGNPLRLALGRKMSPHVAVPRNQSPGRIGGAG